MKRLTAAFFAALLIILSALQISAAAEEKTHSPYGKMLAIGDSITTGYGLPDYEWSDPYLCGSYANRLASALGLEREKTYFNRAVNGDKTGDLLALLPSMKNLVAECDLIVVSIGGNNLLQNIGLLASAVIGFPAQSMEQVVTTLGAASAQDYLKAVSDPSVSTVLASAVASCGTDIGHICDTIKEYNPGARTIFLLQYNPSNKVPGMEGFDMVSAPLIKQINAQITSAVASAGEGFETADAPSVIDQAAAARTNMLSMDIHPNLAGHGMIYKLLCSQLGIADPSACEHNFGEWSENAGDPDGEPYLERVCSKCGYTETKALTQAGTDVQTDAGTGEVTKEHRDKRPVGCASSVPFSVAAAVCAAFAAHIQFRRRRS